MGTNRDYIFFSPLLLPLCERNCSELANLKFEKKLAKENSDLKKSHTYMQHKYIQPETKKEKGLIVRNAHLS